MRNKNVDVMRTAALLWVMVYHIWYYLGKARIPVPVVDLFVRQGGEIGVTFFFLISGYGIYYSIRSAEKKGTLSFRAFWGRRIRRILPEYDLSLFVVLLFTPAAAFLSKALLHHVILHLLFLHNLTPQTAGSINGVLWTMAVIVQFYVIAIPMYFLLRKTRFLFPVIAVIVTAGFKYVMFHHLGYAGDFWASRQLLPSCLDNFALGMFAAWLMEIDFAPKTNRKWLNLVMTAAGVALLYVVCEAGSRFGIHTDNLSGYLWHSLVAACLFLVMFFYGRKEPGGDHALKRIVLWIASYEYGIYIVHLLLIENLIGNSPIMARIALWPWAAYIVFPALSIFAGWVLCKCADGIRRVW